MDLKDEWRQKSDHERKNREIDGMKITRKSLYIQQQYWNKDLITSTPFPSLSLLTKLFQMGGGGGVAP
jgi:hypothetical protein